MLCLDKLSVAMTIIVRNNPPGTNLCKFWWWGNIAVGAAAVVHIELSLLYTTTNIYWAGGVTYCKIHLLDVVERLMKTENWLKVHIAGPACDPPVPPVRPRVPAPPLLPAPLCCVRSRPRRLCRRVHSGVPAAPADCRPLPCDRHLTAELLTSTGECMHVYKRRDPVPRPLEANSCQCIGFLPRWQAAGTGGVIWFAIRKYFWIDQIISNR